LSSELTAGEDGLRDANGSDAIASDVTWISAFFFDTLVTELRGGVSLVLGSFNAALR